jgi:hypothetical protein
VADALPVSPDPTYPWLDAYDSVVTLVKRGDPDIAGRTVGETVNERVRLAFEPLVRAENERLRAALTEINSKSAGFVQGSWGSDICAIARRALGPASPQP